MLCIFWLVWIYNACQLMALAINIFILLSLINISTLTRNSETTIIILNFIISLSRNDDTQVSIKSGLNCHFFRNVHPSHGFKSNLFDPKFISTAWQVLLNSIPCTDQLLSISTRISDRYLKLSMPLMSQPPDFHSPPILISRFL